MIVRVVHDEAGPAIVLLFLFTHDGDLFGRDEARVLMVIVKVVLLSKREPHCRSRYLFALQVRLLVDVRGRHCQFVGRMLLLLWPAKLLNRLADALLFEDLVVLSHVGIDLIEEVRVKLELQFFFFFERSLVFSVHDVLVWRVQYVARCELLIVLVDLA